VSNTLTPPPAEGPLSTQERGRSTQGGSRINAQAMARGPPKCVRSGHHGVLAGNREVILPESRITPAYKLYLARICVNAFPHVKKKRKAGIEPVTSSVIVSGFTAQATLLTR